MLSFQFAVNKNISVLSYSQFLSFIKFDCWAFTLEHPVTADFQYIKKSLSREYNGNGYLSMSDNHNRTASIFRNRYQMIKLGSCFVGIVCSSNRFLRYRNSSGQELKVLRGTSQSLHEYGYPQRIKTFHLGISIHLSV